MTATRTVSRTATSTYTASATPADTPQPSATRTEPAASPTATPTSTSQSTQAPAEGPLSILHCVPLPNPNPRQLAVQLEGNAEEMEVAVYSASLGLLAKATTGPQANGWARVALPAGLANGTYFYRVQAKRGSVRSAAVKGTLVLAN